jgi:hypothetical protein
MTKPKGAKPQGESQRGEKRQYLREAIETLGLDAKYLDAAKWVKNKYGVEVSDPTFYHLRREMQIEAGKRPQSGAGTGKAEAAGGEPSSPKASQTETSSAGITGAKGGDKKQSQGGAPQAAGSLPQDGVAALVLQAKRLVARLGKDEAKKLIDAV